jgi:hypothetical protein
VLLAWGLVTANGAGKGGRGQEYTNADVGANARKHGKKLQGRERKGMKTFSSSKPWRNHPFDTATDVTQKTRKK